MTSGRAKGKGCWYFVSGTGCPLCSAYSEARERRWGPRPKRPEDRREYIEVACTVHFL